MRVWLRYTSAEWKIFEAISNKKDDELRNYIRFLIINKVRELPPLNCNIQDHLAKIPIAPGDEPISLTLNISYADIIKKLENYADHFNIPVKSLIEILVTDPVIGRYLLEGRALLPGVQG